jgi:soluble lytic murein transglycosylase
MIKGSRTLVLYCILASLTLELSGCSHLSQWGHQSTQDSVIDSSVVEAANSNPTPVELITISEKTSEGPLHWWANYKLARDIEGSDPQKACELYSDLSESSKFPLRKLALLRAILTCKKIDQFTLPTGDLPQIYSDLYYKAQERFLKEENDNIALALNLQNRARISKNIREKVSLLKQALSFTGAASNEQFRFEIESQLYKIAPHLQPSPLESQYLEVAKGFQSERVFDKALLYFDQTIKSKNLSNAQIKEAYRAKRQTLKNMNDKTTALTVSEQWANWAKSQYAKKSPDGMSLYLDASLNYARAVWTEGQATKAKSILNKVILKLKKKTSLQEVYFTLARISEEEKDYNGALALFSKALKEQPVANTTEKILWSKSWVLRKQKKYHQSADVLKSLLQMSKDPFDKNRFSFWLGKTLLATGAADEGKSQLLALRSEDPIGYYGLLTYLELNEPLPPLSRDQLNNRKNWHQGSIGIAKPIRTELEWLVALGEGELAGAWIQQLLGPVDTKKQEFTADELYLFSKLAEAGQFLPLFSRYGYLSSTLKNKFVNERLSLLFPRPHFRMVKEAADKSAIRSELIYSIMRQESAFNPKTRSFADAFGLLQLLPELAETYKERTGFSIKDHEELYDPNKNILLGAVVLSELNKKYQNRFILATGAYNASDKAIMGWLNTRYNNNSLEFIEDIPYEETRSYIKLVMRNYIYYLRISQIEREVAFPSDLLKI